MVITAGANNLQSVTLPIAFPLNNLYAIGSSSGSINSFAGAVPNGLTAIKVFGSNNGAAVAWLAIGV